jgi:intracellular sulfur oxidation DsrE/DsrF family protein
MPRKGVSRAFVNDGILTRDEEKKDEQSHGQNSRHVNERNSVKVRTNMQFPKGAIDEGHFSHHEGTIMKLIGVSLLLVFLSVGLGFAQERPYKVVFDLTSRDSLDQKAVMRWVSEISAANPKAQLEVVMYAKGFEMVMPEKSTVLGQVREALKNPNVKFKACEVALKNNNVEKRQLLQEVQTVPDGIYEIISKQHEGWGYIKVMH